MRDNQKWFPYFNLQSEDALLIYILLNLILNTHLFVAISRIVLATCLQKNIKIKHASLIHT